MINDHSGNGAELFTKEDRGGYRAPTFKLISGGELGGPELEAKILEACSEKFRFRSLPMIHRHCDISFSNDLRTVISAMCVGHQLREFSNGQMTAWFPFEQMPTKTWLGPERTVEAEFEKGFVPRDEDKKLREMSGFGSINEFTGDDRVQSEAGFNAFKEPLGNRANRSKKRIYIDERKLEDLATSYANQQEIAEGLGMGVSYLQLRLKEDPDLRERFNDWRDEYVKIQAEKAGSIREKTKMETTGTAAARETVPAETNGHKPETADAKPPKFDLELVEQYAREGKSQKEAAELLGTTAFVFKNHLNITVDRRAREAWDRGRAECETLPPRSPRLQTAPAENVEKPKTDGRGKWSRKKVEIDGDRLVELAEQYGSHSKVIKELGIAHQTLNRRLKGDPDLKARFEAAKDRFVDANGVRSRNVKADSSVDIDPAKLRDLAASGSSTRHAAAELGISQGKLNYVLYGSKNDGIPKSDAHADAWKAGREIFKATGKKKSTVKAKPGDRTQKAAKPAPELVADRDEIVPIVTIDESASENEIDAMANAFDTLNEEFPGDEITQDDVNELNEMIKRAEEEQAAPYIAELLAIAEAEDPNQAAALDTVGAKPKSHRYITFKNGAQLLIGFDGNLFDLDPIERTFIEDAIQLMEGFETSQEHSGRGTALHIHIAAGESEASADEVRRQLRDAVELNFDLPRTEEPVEIFDHSKIVWIDAPQKPRSLLERIRDWFGK